MTHTIEKSGKKHEARFIYALAIICLMSICSDFNHLGHKSPDILRSDTHTEIVYAFFR